MAALMTTLKIAYDYRNKHTNHTEDIITDSYS